MTAVEYAAARAVLRDGTDVVIRPVASHRAGVTSWPLSRSTGSTVSVKMRIEPAVRRPQPRVHPGHDWFYVLEGRIRLTLGERMIVVSAADPSSCREFRYQDGKNQLVNTYDDRTLRADSLYAATTAIDEEVWASLAPQKLIAAAENSLGRGWTFGADGSSGARLAQVFAPQAHQPA